MLSRNLIWCAMFASAFLLLVPGNNNILVGARSSSGFSRINKLLRDSAGTSSSSSSSLDLMEAKAKRSVLDKSCQGIYDREFFRKLDRVCEDCYNVYRKPSIGVDCRSECYCNMVFRQCLDDLLLNDVVDEYINIVQLVGK